MRILGIGTDIVECPRIGRMIEQYGELFLARVYTDREIRHCQARKHAIEHFAAWWAGKEAVMKALGRGRFTRTDLEIRPAEIGRLQVMVRGPARDAAIALGVADIHLSLSHCRTYATAYALVGGVDRPTGGAVSEGTTPPTGSAE